MRISLLRTTVFTVILMQSSAALAETLDKFVKPVPGSTACWHRIYSDGHLAKHPQQKVTSIRFNLEYYEMDHHQAGKGNSAFSIDIATREHKGGVLGLCSDGDGSKIICGGECDAGAASVRYSGSNGSVLVELESGGLSLTGCDSDNPFWLSAEPDDQLFLLHPKACEGD